MEILVAGGAAVDIATRQDLEAHHERIRKALERPHARYHRLVGARPPVAANKPFIIPLDTPRPPTGWMWEVQWVSIYGDDPTVSAAIANVRAAVLVGTRPTDASLTNPPASGVDYAGVILPGLAVPTPGSQNVPDKNIVYSDEELYALLAGTGLVAGAGFYHFNAGVIELPQTADALMW